MGGSRGEEKASRPRPSHTPPHLLPHFGFWKYIFTHFSQPPHLASYPPPQLTQFPPASFTTVLFMLFVEEGKGFLQGTKTTWKCFKIMCSLQTGEKAMYYNIINLSKNDQVTFYIECECLWMLEKSESISGHERYFSFWEWTFCCGDHTSYLSQAPWAAPV